MDHYIKNSVSDITYVPELILDIKDAKDLIRPNNLRPSTYALGRNPQ